MQRNTMGKTRDLFKNIGNIKGTFHTRVGMICKDLIETEEVKKEVARIHRTIKKRS